MKKNQKKQQSHLIMFIFVHLILYPNFENLTTHITSLLAAFKVETLHNKSDECRTKAGGLVLFRPPTESKHETIGKLTEFFFKGKGGDKNRA